MSILEDIIRQMLAVLISDAQTTTVDPMHMIGCLMIPQEVRKTTTLEKNIKHGFITCLMICFFKAP